MRPAVLSANGTVIHRASRPRPGDDVRESVLCCVVLSLSPRSSRRAVGRSLGRNARRREERGRKRKKDCSVSQSGSLRPRERKRNAHRCPSQRTRVWWPRLRARKRTRRACLPSGEAIFAGSGRVRGGADSGVGGTGTLVQRRCTRPLAWCPDLPRRAHRRGRADRIFRCDFRVDCWATHCFLVPIGKSSSVMRSSMGVYGNSITEPGTSYAGLRESGAHSEMHAYTYLPPRARTKLLPDRARPYERTPAETTRPWWVSERAREEDDDVRRRGQRERVMYRGGRVIFSANMNVIRLPRCQSAIVASIMCSQGRRQTLSVCTTKRMGIF